MAGNTSATSRLWQGLQGTWHLHRKLHSINAAEPSGKCFGTATFTARQPATFVDEDGKLQQASKEMLFSEQGEFEISSTLAIAAAPKFSFSRKYVWRLQEQDTSSPEISIWFVKPGTEEIDYLFHTLTVQSIADKPEGAKGVVEVECSGGHLCVEDFYSSIYKFELIETRDTGSANLSLQHWTMLHEVRGPKKDQVIETKFTRS